MLEQCQPRPSGRGRLRLPAGVKAILSTYAMTQVPSAQTSSPMAPRLFPEGGRWAVLDLKVPATRLAASAARNGNCAPFRLIDEWIMRRPWRRSRGHAEELTDLSGLSCLRNRIPRCRVPQRSISMNTDSPSLLRGVGEQFACLGESGRLVQALLGDRVIPYRLACSGVAVRLAEGGVVTGVPLESARRQDRWSPRVRRLSSVCASQEGCRACHAGSAAAGVGEYLAVRPVQG